MKTIYQTSNLNHGKKSFSFQNEVFYYDINKKVVTIYGLMSSLSDYSIELISYVFENFACNKIEIKQVIKDNELVFAENAFLKISLPQNYCLELPLTLEEYVSSLGKKTRQHLKWYQRQLDKWCAGCEVLSNIWGGVYCRK